MSYLVYVEIKDITRIYTGRKNIHSDVKIGKAKDYDSAIKLMQKFQNGHHCPFSIIKEMRK